MTDKTRDELGKTMLHDLKEISELLGPPFKYMQLGQDGVFLEVTEAEFFKKSACLEDCDESEQNKSS